MASQARSLTAALDRGCSGYSGTGAKVDAEFRYGFIDPLDSGFVLARLGCDVGAGDPGCDVADMNGDGVLDPLDVGFVRARLGKCE